MKFLCILNVNIFFSSYVFAESAMFKEYSLNPTVQQFYLTIGGSFESHIEILPHTQSNIIFQSNGSRQFTIKCEDASSEISFKCILTESSNQMRVENISTQNGNNNIVIQGSSNSDIKVNANSRTVTQVHSGSGDIIAGDKTVIAGVSNVSLFQNIQKTLSALIATKEKSNQTERTFIDNANDKITVYVPFENFILNINYDYPLSLAINSSNKEDKDIFFQSPSLNINKNTKGRNIFTRFNVGEKQISIKGFFAAVQLTDFPNPVIINNRYPFAVYKITSSFSDSNVSMNFSENELIDNAAIVSDLKSRREALLASKSMQEKLSEINIPKSSLEIHFLSKESEFYKILHSNNSIIIADMIDETFEDSERKEVSFF